MPGEIQDLMIHAALVAGGIILRAYAKPIHARSKADGSPVTDADGAAEKAILEILAVTGLPVLAEESVADGYIPRLGNHYFIVDPLDGTREFVKRNGEFTVNIALIENGYPVAGIVTAPAQQRGYIGTSNGAFSFAIEDGEIGSLKPMAVNKSGPMQVVASRSHGHHALAELCTQMKISRDVSVGSSLKFCLLADGTARLYPRFTPTCEWDTAAGQAVLEAAGGTVVTLDGKRLGYGKKERQYLNPYFVAADDMTLAMDAASRMRSLLGPSKSK